MALLQISEPNVKRRLPYALADMDGMAYVRTAQGETQITQYLDAENQPEQAAQVVRAWMFVDKLLKTI